MNISIYTLERVRDSRLNSFELFVEKRLFENQEAQICVQFG